MLARLDWMSSGSFTCAAMAVVWFLSLSFCAAILVQQCCLLGKLLVKAQQRVVYLVKAGVSLEAMCGKYICYRLDCDQGVIVCMSGIVKLLSVRLSGNYEEVSTYVC